MARSENSPFAVIEHPVKRLYGMQFHPEVAHTPRGREILQNFVYQVCGCKTDWTMGSFIEQTCAEIRQTVGKERVILGLSGGVDSSVAAMLLHQAIGDQLTCIFVNNGLLRENEAEAVQKLFGDNFHIKLQYVDASERFLEKLAGVTDPEQKRKIIGNEFVRVFERAAVGLENRWPGGRTPLSRPGDALPGRDRERLHFRQPGRAHQEPPQRRRPARRHGVRAAGAVAAALQGRGAAGRAATGAAQGGRPAPAFPGTRAGGAHPRRSDRGAAAHPARGRHHRGQRDEVERLVLPRLAILRGAAAGALRRGDGRRAHLREHRGLCASSRARTA